MTPIFVGDNDSNFRDVPIKGNLFVELGCGYERPLSSNYESNHISVFPFFFEAFHFHFVIFLLSKTYDLW